MRPDLCRAGQSCSSRGRCAAFRPLGFARRVDGRSAGAGRCRRPPDGRRAHDGTGDADRTRPGRDALDGPRRRPGTARRVADLRRGHGTHPFRRASAGPPRADLRPSGTDDHGRVGVQGAAAHRMAGRLGHGASGDPARRPPRWADQRRLPGRHRAAGGGDRPRGPGRRRRRGRRDRDLAGTVRGDPRAAVVAAGRPAGRRLVAARRPPTAGPVPRRPVAAAVRSRKVAATPMDGWGPSGGTICGSCSPTSRWNGSATSPNGSGERSRLLRCGSGWRRP